MRKLLFLLLLPTLSGCGDDATVLQGELAEGSDATHVWVLGGPARAVIEADSFRLEDIRGDTLDLRFSAGEDEVARMEIQGAPRGGHLRLSGVWFDDGIAFPAAVEMEEGGMVTINGLRMAGPAAVPGEVDVRARVLAVSREGDALLVRPGEERLPDLRVVVTPGTRVRTPDGDDGSSEDLEFGDSIQVRGVAEGGYVVATELVLP